MDFPPLNEDATKKLLADFAPDGWKRLGVVLTDGATLSGNLYAPSEKLKADHPDRDRLHDGLRLHVGLKEILVPVDQIAGLFPADFEQPSETFSSFIDLSPEPETSSSSRSAQPRSESVRSALDAAALQCAAEHRFEVQQWVYSASIQATLLRYGRWKAPRHFQPLYCDWEYFARRAGGLRGIGGGFIASASASGQPSLFRDAYREIAGKVKDRSTICRQTTGLVEGFVSSVSSVQVADTERVSLTMDGSPWQATVVRGGSLSGEELESSGSWVIAYFATHGLSIPLDMWPHSGQPIRVFGDVVPVDAETDLGPAGCFIKARAAACLRSK